MRINYDILFITKLRPVTYLEVEYRNFALVKGRSPDLQVIKSGPVSLDKQ